MRSKKSGAYSCRVRDDARLRESLIGAEINLAALNDFSVLDLRSRITERSEDLILGVIDQDVAVGEIEDLRATMFAGPVPTSVPKLPADLKRDGSLTGPGRHRQKHARLAGNDRFDRTANSDLLVITLALFESEVDRRQELFNGGVVLQVFAVAIALPKFLA